MSPFMLSNAGMLPWLGVAFTEVIMGFQTRMHNCSVMGALHIFKYFIYSCYPHQGCLSEPAVLHNLVLLLPNVYSTTGTGSSGLFLS